jgi:glycosyltransferase involved in cell wall biosynthesis
MRPSLPEPPSASVVIPCWRCSEVVGRALASVAEQTLPALEVLLVDDASGDDTLPVLHSLREQYPPGWIKVIARQDNGGPGPACNAGWEAARGQYVAFLDADDAWHPRKLELHLAWLRSHPEAVLSGHRSVLRNESEAPVRVDGPGAARRVTLGGMLISNRFPTRSVILRRELPFRFQGRGVTEDYLLWLEVVASGAPCYVLEAPLAFSFQPEFSPGGYSGRLWAHEQRELAALSALRARGILAFPLWVLASAWSLCKYVRREGLARMRSAPGSQPAQGRA